MTLRHRLLHWVAEHDDSWLFIVLYVGLGLVLSMTISLFWLAVVVAAHGVIEWVAMGRQGIRDHRLGRVLWHLKLDIGLTLVAPLEPRRQVRRDIHHHLGRADPARAGAHRPHGQLGAGVPGGRPAPLAGRLICRLPGRGTGPESVATAQAKCAL